jgi:hypothetical protein
VCVILADFDTFMSGIPALDTFMSNIPAADVMLVTQASGRKCKRMSFYISFFKNGAPRRAISPFQAR